MTIHYDIETDGLYLEGIEKGVSLKERDFTLNLWAAQEFSLPKIAMLVGVSVEEVRGTILAHLKEGGKTQDEAAFILEVYEKAHP